LRVFILRRNIDDLHDANADTPVAVDWLESIWNCPSGPGLS